MNLETEEKNRSNTEMFKNEPENILTKQQKYNNGIENLNEKLTVETNVINGKIDEMNKGFHN
jgi:hypothetical protein